MQNTHPNIALFEKLVRHAVDAGWTIFGTIPFKGEGGAEWAIIDKGSAFSHTPILAVIGKGASEKYRAYYEFEQVIFDHDFNRKLWGTEKREDGWAEWEFHIQQVAVTRYRMDYFNDVWEDLANV